MKNALSSLILHQFSRFWMRCKMKAPQNKKNSIYIHVYTNINKLHVREASQTDQTVTGLAKSASLPKLVHW
jgi:hypothetical protein